MASIKDNAIVLRRLDYSETSQVLAFFMRAHGQRRLIAKGIKRGTRKKFATGIDLLEQGEVVFWDRPHGESQLSTLTEWRQTELFLGLRTGLDRWYAGQYAAEITSGMTQEADPHPELYDALARFLSQLSAGQPVLRALVLYQSALLSSVGLSPDLSKCVVCGRAAPPNRAAYFTARQGGLVCRNCGAKLDEKRLAQAGVLTFLRDPLIASEPSVERGAFDLLDYTIAHALGRRITLSTSGLGAR
jgi:DNA repair protein RecO (recombination protein O)